ncbi:MAG TPA: mercuric ion transporter MerT [Betaproteobacteria bacterium]|nr:mercuric ion transporter MerT [Betaproteobacteria bacterium]
MIQQKKFSGLPLIGGVAAAIAASACCLGPLVLVMLGVSGAWIGNLTVLEPYRPYFLGIAVIFLIFAWRKIYRAPAAETCTPGSLCAMPQTNRIYRILFWLVAALIGIAFVFPYLAPLFY